jgi:hypothetical protein
MGKRKAPKKAAEKKTEAKNAAPKRMTAPRPTAATENDGDSSATDDDWIACASYTFRAERRPKTTVFRFIAKDAAGTQHSLQVNFSTDDQTLPTKLLGVLQTTWPDTNIKFKSKKTSSPSLRQITEIEKS